MILQQSVYGSLVFVTVFLFIKIFLLSDCLTVTVC